MGRRNINTTKSGKFMNPTDRARKEARRRELKKNKKQRMAVRQAVLKSKDAMILLEEAELYDRQEFDPKHSTSLSDRVLQEKRKKLLETFDRMIVLYRKEEPEKAGELQTMRNDYERKRGEMIMFYEQVKLAEKVNANEIPLPDIPQETQLQILPFLGDIPLPPGVNIPPHPGVLVAAAMASVATPGKGILKKQTDLQIPGPPPGLPSLYKKPCAPPPGTPDELSDVDSEEGELDQSADASVDNKSRKIRFAEDNNYDATKDTRMTISKMMTAMTEMPLMPPLSMIPPPGFMPANRIPVPPGLPPPLPILSGQSSVPGYHPNPSSISMPPQMFTKPTRPAPMMMMTGPSASVSTATTTKRDIHHHLQPNQQQHNHHLAVSGTKKATGATTIEAKPQLKNLIGDSTKLVPTSLRIKKNVVAKGARHGVTDLKSDKYIREFVAASKDDAYDVFMKEMEGLL